jgi:hypothetical protein
MGLASEIEILKGADNDLRQIGGKDEDWLFRELDGLPRMSEQQCPELPWRPKGEAPRRRVRLGPFVAIFFVEQRPHENGVTRIAVVEWIAHRTQIDERLAALRREAKAREEREVEADKG